MTSTDVLVLAGKRPRPGTVLAEVRARLERDGLGVSIDWREPLGVLAAVRPALLVHRGLAPATLERLARALEASDHRVAAVNSPAACLLALDRTRALDALRGAGVLAPQSSVHDDWEDVRRQIRGGDLYVKAVSGATGRGAGVAALSRDAGDGADPPFPGPWHVEAAWPGDGQDRKLYVAGSRVFGLLKAWPRDGAPARAFEPPPAMAELALAAGRAVGLELYGVDLVGRDGEFAAVDLNPFPGYRGVEGAAAAVAEHVAARIAAARSH